MVKKILKFIVIFLWMILTFIVGAFVFGTAWAQTSTSSQSSKTEIILPPSAPKLEVSPPELITLMQESGAKVKFLGSELGLNGWLLQRDNQAQTVYSTLDGKAVIIGLLYDAYGTAVTERQLSEAEKQQSLVRTTPKDLKQKNAPPFFDQLKSRLFSAAGATYGTRGPLFHIFMDPRCPYCHALWQDAIPLIEQGHIRVHVIPVGLLGKASAELSTSILDDWPQTENVKANWNAAMQTQRLGATQTLGAASATRAAQALGAGHVERNNRLFFDWKGKGVPLLVFEKNGELLVHSGKPDNFSKLLR